MFLLSYVAYTPVCLFAGDSKGSSKQLKSLPPVKKQRFKITDRVWPEKYGQADVCIWKDDKLASCSITIDDNMALDHEWWIEQGNKYKFKFTWFVITSRIKEPRNKYHGTWDDFKKLHKLGHDVQSHTVTHRSKKMGKSAEDDYKEAIFEIQENIPGNIVLVLAYPGGNILPNDFDVAMKYHVSGRGTTGHLNKVNKINYQNTKSLNKFTFKDNHWAAIPDTIKINPKRKNNYRAWHCMHFHGVTDKHKENISKGFEYLKKNEKDFWVGKFLEVVLYAQERDTAELKTVSALDNEIKLQLTDSMDDAIFDYPLTLKVRLAPEWNSVKAEQDGKEIKAEIIKHNDQIFALVQAVPDKGIIVLKQK